jgi:hypothetical protein
MNADAGNTEEELWMVLYEAQGSQLVRHAIHSPSPQRMSEGGTSLLSAVNTISCRAGSILRRGWIRVKFSYVSTQTVGAHLSQDMTSLLMVTLVGGASTCEGACGRGYFRFQTVSCRTWAVHVPVIDVLDWSAGLHAPVFCVRCDSILLALQRPCITDHV